MATVFELAKPRVKAPVPVGKVLPKKNPIIEGLEMFASLTMVSTWLSNMSTTYGAQVRDVAREIFIKDGMERKAQPVSIYADEGVATANIQCRKRSVASILSDLEMEQLASHGITSILKLESGAEETYVINPAYVRDSALLKRVDRALKNVKDLPEDFIQVQEAPPPRYVITEQTIKDVLSLNDKDVVAELMPVIFSAPAIRAKLTDGDVKKALKRVLAEIESKEKEEY